MALRKGLLLVREYETDWMGARHGPFGGVADRMKHESLALHGSETANRAIRRVISWAAIALGPYMTARISQELASRRGVDAWVQTVEGSQTGGLHFSKRRFHSPLKLYASYAGIRTIAPLLPESGRRWPTSPWISSSSMGTTPTTGSASTLSCIHPSCALVD